MYFITSIAKDDTRCVGYVSTLEEAIDIVENNRCDLNEAGCYPWCVIEHIREGIYQYDFKPHWFEYNDETNKYIEREYKPPFISNELIGFAIRLERNCFMKFKEFNDWCNERACDGCWGLNEAMTCIDICHLFSYIPKWKQEKAWQHFLSRDVLEQIVIETNKIIEKTKQDTVF